MSQPDVVSALRRLAAGLAHDLNNILGGVSSLASASLLEAPNDAIADDLKQIVRTTREGLQVAARLAILGHSAQPKVAQVDVSSVMQRMSSLFPAANIRCPESIQAQLDTKLMQEAISALIQNAIEASNAANVTVQEIGSNLIITVQNTITQKINIEELLQPYTSTKKEGRGKGLGLTIAQAVAMAHQGAFSLSQQGDLVTATLQVARGVNTSKEKPTILLADDEKPMRLALERLLSRAGYQVLISTDGQEALDMFVSQQNAVDLVLLDRWMPNLNGPEVVQEIRRMGKTLPIFLLSGEIGEAPDVPGVTAWIEKPFEPAELLRTLQGALPTR
jgi:CheY-like chemotaxis protein